MGRKWVRKVMEETADVGKGQIRRGMVALLRGLTLREQRGATEELNQARQWIIEK